MSATRYSTTGVAVVKITVSSDAPDDLFTRMAAGDLPKSLYGVMDRVQVFEHWTYNAVRNGVTDASDLDGWADMERGLVVLNVSAVDDIFVETSEAVR